MRYFRRSDGRIYSVFPPAQDLLGDWIVLTVHGSIHNRLGGTKTFPAPDQAAAVLLGNRIARTRCRRGYIEQRSDHGADPTRIG